MKRLLVLIAACSSAPTKPAELPPHFEETKPMPHSEPPPAPPQPKIVTQTARPQELAFPDEEFRHKQPAPSKLRPFKLPKPKTFTLASGIDVYLVEQHALPIVSMDLNMDGGSLADAKGKDGMAGICMAMMTEGTDKLDKLQYAEALADIASSVSTYATDDAHGVTLSSLSKHLDATFDLFAETILSPGLRDKDFDRLRKRRIESIKAAKGSPQSIAPRVTGAVLYGHDHPFGAVVTEASLRAVELDDCKKFVATWVKPKHARLFVVGDLTEEQIRARFDKGALAGWKGETPKVPAFPGTKTMAGRIFFVNVPGAAQSQVSLLQFGPKRTAPDYFATTLVGAVFGGGFASRINMNLREDKGYSYGARGGFSYTRTYGTFSASAGVQANATYQSLLEISREVEALAAGKHPVEASELERESKGAILALPGRFATAQAALGQYRSLVYYGLPLDYFDSYAAKVGAVKDADVKAAAKKQLHPDQAVYLVVGDGDAKVIVRDGDKDVPLTKGDKQLTLREALTDLAAAGTLGKGALVELDADGRPL